MIINKTLVDTLSLSIMSPTYFSYVIANGTTEKPLGFTSLTLSICCSSQEITGAATVILLLEKPCIILGMMFIMVLEADFMFTFLPLCLKRLDRYTWLIKMYSIKKPNLSCNIYSNKPLMYPKI